MSRQRRGTGVSGDLLTYVRRAVAKKRAQALAKATMGHRPDFQ